MPGVSGAATVTTVTTRKLTTPPAATVPILIADSGCDQTLLGFIWRVLDYTGQQIILLGALAGRHAGSSFQVVTGAAKLIGTDGRAYCAIAHQALYDPSDEQYESLLSVHQSCRVPENAIDDRSTEERDVHGNFGTQRSKFGTIEVPFYFDGAKCYYRLAKITDEEMKSLPTVVLTGNEPYDPHIRRHSRRLTLEESLDWKKNLGFPTDEVVQRTLVATTQMVPSVETETREIMRDHLKTRIPELKITRRNDIAFMDTLFVPQVDPWLHVLPALLVQEIWF